MLAVMRLAEFVQGFVLIILGCIYLVFLTAVLQYLATWAFAVFIERHSLLGEFTSRIRYIFWSACALTITPTSFLCFFIHV